MSRLRALSFLLFSMAATTAAANPRPLPFTYPSEMLQPKQLEIEQYADLTPVPALVTGGNTSTLLQTALITEIEYGLIDRLELGLYFQLSSLPSTLTGETSEAPINFDGVAQRLRYAFARPGKWPIDVEVYGEISEFQHELEVEAKIILQRKIGHVRIMANLVAEHESYYTGRQEWVFAPTGGVSWEVLPWLNIGLEYWSHGETGATGPGVAAESNSSVGQFDQQFHSFLGPAIMLQFNRIWWAVAPYLRLDSFNRTPHLGDEYGKYWIRSVIGIDIN